MIQRYRHWLWLVLIVPVTLGLMRLSFDVEVLDLLPSDVRAVQGLKLYQQHFANARELIVTVQGHSAEQAENAARSLAEALRKNTNLVAQVTWQPPWLEHPGQAAELLAYLWFNQPPELFNQLTNRLNPDQAPATLAAAREQLATSLSPGDIARLSYDPFGLTRLPESVAGSAPGFTQGQEMFASADGAFRIVFVQARNELTTYRDCATWLTAIKRIAGNATVESERSSGGLTLGYTGRPAFVSEISGGMEHDMTASVGGTSLIIAILFWIAHRRWKPMLWLLVLLALILVGTLGLGGLLFGHINVVSMGFAAILLGLAVDYAVVHYQEALAHPDLSVPEIRRAIAPSIFWAAVTTISAFLVLNLGGLPGLAQLGSLVGLGVALAACVMIFAFLPPLFPGRRRPKVRGPTKPTEIVPKPPHPVRIRLALAASILVLLCCSIILVPGLPQMDPTANALRPRNSPSYAALDEIQTHLGEKREPLWLIVAGSTETEVARQLDRVEAALTRASSNGILSSFNLPTTLWPRPEFQAKNRSVARELATRRDAIRAAARVGGFTESSLALTEGMLDTWQDAGSNTNVFWPGNEMSEWIFSKVVARSATHFYALGLLYPEAHSPDSSRLAALASDLPPTHVWLSGWSLLGNAVFSIVKENMWKLLVPMIALVLLSLLAAFRRLAEVLLSIGTLLLSGLCLLAIMRLAGWSWNLLNLMGIPLILGTGVDYSIFTQLALRRYHGDLQMAYRSVGRALLLCGATAVAGFSSLAWSTNAGMSSLGAVCAVGIAGNMILSVFLLPIWWHTIKGRAAPVSLRRAEEPEVEDRVPGPSTLDARRSTPSFFYRAEFWRIGLCIARFLPRKLCAFLSCSLARMYWFLVPQRREIVIQNLLPALNNDRAAATTKAKAVFHQFALKLADLWRYESGSPIDDMFGPASGWEHLAQAQSEKRGVLLLTPHLGNWEFGGPWLTQKGIRLQVITLDEPGEGFTKLRQASRARRNIDTLVIGNDPFAFLEIIRRLEAGATVALLVDRPPPATAVTVELFGRPFSASIAAAELARASGCILLPVYLPRTGAGYAAHVLPPIPYDRAALRDRKVRQQLTQEILHAFEPILCEHLDQWFHFVPIWPKP